MSEDQKQDAAGQDANASEKPAAAQPAAAAQTPERTVPELGPEGAKARAAVLKEIPGSESWDEGRPRGAKVAPMDMVDAAKVLAGLGWRLDCYTVVDRRTHFELVAQVAGPGAELVSLRCDLPPTAGGISGGEGETAEVDDREFEMDTLTGVWPSASWFEREVYDLFGVRFNGHPDLRRIMLIDDFPGHPFRKTYPLDVIEEGGEDKCQT